MWHLAHKRANGFKNVTDATGAYTDHHKLLNTCIECVCVSIPVLAILYTQNSSLRNRGAPSTTCTSGENAVLYSAAMRNYSEMADID